jgi:hypothetical protein
VSTRLHTGANTTIETDNAGFVIRRRHDNLTIFFFFPSKMFHLSGLSTLQKREKVSFPEMQIEVRFLYLGAYFKDRRWSWYTLNDTSLQFHLSARYWGASDGPSIIFSVVLLKCIFQTVESR